MSRRKRIFTTVLLSLAGLAVVLVVGALLVMQTTWFHDYVRNQIIAITEDSTGGKVDLGSFDFDWKHLRATIRNFVLHGTEPAGQAPLFQASLLQLDLSLFSGLWHMIDLTALKVDRPQANVIVYPDGRTNVPEPKIKSKSNTTALQTIVDLKIGRFDLEHGSFAFNAQKTSFSAHGENLLAQLFYTAVKPGYQGRITMEPLYLASGGNTPLHLNVALPLVIESDRIQVNDGKIATAESQVTLNAAVDQMAAPIPHVSGHISAHLALADAQHLASAPLQVQTGPGLPSGLDADVVLDSRQNTINISSARVSLGDSRLEAAGTLQDPSGQNSAHFNTTLALGQLGRLFKVSAQPSGLLEASGNARIVGSSGYNVTASIRGSQLGFRQGEQQIRNISLQGNLSADPKTIGLEGLKVAAFGGEVTGKANLENLRQLRLALDLHGFSIRTLAQTLAAQDLPYDGVISGPVEASADVQAPGTKSVRAQVRLAIAPGGSGTPVSGKVDAGYNGATDIVTVADSYVALPSTRLDLSGSLDHQLNIKLVSRNLNDFQPALNMGSHGKPQELPVQLRGGTATFTGAVTGKLASPQIDGHLEASAFQLEDRPFDRFDADLHAAANGARIENGSLTRAAARLQFAGAVGLHNWKPENYEPLTVNASIQNADVSDLLAIAGQKDVPVKGTLTATAQIGGTVGNPRGKADLNVLNGTAYDEHFDRLAANVNFADQLVQLTNTQLTAGAAHIDLNAAFNHPKDSFETGTLQVHLVSNQMSLDQFNAVRKQNQGLQGTVQLNADATANLNQVQGQSELLVTSVNANASAHALQLEGKNLGDLTATAQTSGSTVAFNVNSDFAGSTIRVNGQTRLQKDYPTTASTSINNLPIEQVLAVAGRKDIDAKGNLSATAQLSGTLDNPQATVDLNLTKAVIEQEPIDRIQGTIAYNNLSIQLTNLRVTEGPSQIEVSGNFEHPQGNLEEGRVQFHAASNQIQLGRLHIVQQYKQGLNGSVQITADGAGSLRKLPAGSTEPPLLLSSLNANAGVHGLEVNGKPLGDATLKAETHGTDLAFNLTSDVGRSNIQGQGQVRLQGDYPMTAQVSFSNVTYAGLLPLFGTTSTALASMDALAEGQATLSGPALKPENMTGALRVSKLLLKAAPRGQPANGDKTVQVQNEGPIVVTLQKNVLNVQSGHLTGPSTDIKLGGAIALNDKQPLNLQVSANTNLKLLEPFNHDLYSDGEVALQLVVRGTFTDPLLNGELRLQKASLNLIDLPNGISNANGVIRFNGTTAVIQNLKAESGGGTVTLGGFLGFGGGNLRYGLRANAGNVRVRDFDVSLVASAALTLDGNSDHSLLAGTVTLNRIAFNPKSDFGSLLSRTSTPVETPSAPVGPLAGMKLDIRIRTAPDVALQTALAQNLQADADLTLRGTIATPGMLGRVNVTSGKLVFFGSTYDVNAGSVSFFNPLKIDPILDVDLETKTQGVDVILSVSGPVDNMKLSYRSDPPLQFNEIVALLAAGKTPTSDPTILANQPAPPPQSLQQMGESAIVSQAVAAPLADRLQRVFGVTQVKIDPTFVAGSQLPLARLTLQQQIAQNITFTYITDLAQSNAQIITVEWDFNSQWSAVATRDWDGRFGVDFFYKRQIR